MALIQWGNSGACSHNGITIWGKKKERKKGKNERRQGEAYLMEVIRGQNVKLTGLPVDKTKVKGGGLKAVL